MPPNRTMRALVSVPGHPIDDPRSVAEIELPIPTLGPRDLLVQVQAVAVNPRDYKQRALPFASQEHHRLLGWDAAGIVTAVGTEVTLMQPGDAVYYAGTSARDGCNAQWHAVDERLVGLKPQSLSFVQAASVPLTGLTAWEALVDRLHLGDEARPAPPGTTVLVIGGAGGVGTMAIQLAAKVLGLRVIATASRPESRQWCEAQGAHHVIDHSTDLVAQTRALGLTQVDAVLILNAMDRHFPAASELVRPQGGICSIVEPKHPLDMALLRRKSGTLSWELMFTRSVYQTPDMIEQHRILSRLSDLIDHGVLQCPLHEDLSPLTAHQLWRAYRTLETGHAIGKVALAGW
jgi:NADPH2:quinone reductase